jgi:hypothetical protein
VAFLLLAAGIRYGAFSGLGEVVLLRGLGAAVLLCIGGMVVCGQADQIRLALRVATNTQAIRELLENTPVSTQADGTENSPASRP